LFFIIVVVVVVFNFMYGTAEKNEASLGGRAPMLLVIYVIRHGQAK